MYGLYCDGCGAPLLVDSNVRYVTKIEVFAAYDPLEITEADLAEAGEKAWREVVAECKGKSAAELEAEVYLQMRYDLCPVCRRAYVQDPLNVLKDRRPPAAQGTAGDGPAPSA